MKNGLEINEWGTKRYYLNDKLHREEGPAIEYPCGDKEWFQNGLYHRLDGPAIEWYNGSGWWYFHGKRIECSSQKEFENKIAELIFS
jgi:hypothetical protein